MDQSYNCKDDGDKAVPEKLLEDCWYFSNLLDKKIIMSENSSDSNTPSNCSKHSLSAGKSFEETYQSIKKIPVQNESRTSSSPMRAPSMPPRLERKHSNPIAKGRDLGRRKSKEETMSSINLARETSLPMILGLGAEEVEDEEENEFSMGKLIRQASLKSSDALPLKRDAAKGPITISSSTSMTKEEFNSRKLERLRPRRAMSQLKTQKSLSDLQSRELQGFKELGLQEKSKGKNTRWSNLSEAWRQQDSEPEGGGKRSTEEDVKAQIKFWARAVASNVR